MISKQLLNIVILLSLAFSKMYATPICKPCNDNPLQQIYPNQNQCLLLSQIPPELSNLSYGFYPFPHCNKYNTLRFGYNKRFNFFPHAIFTPAEPKDVVYLLQNFKKYNLQFSVRSGGHCYGPGSLSNGYVIDLRNFNDIKLDIPSQTVYIGAGNHLGDVIQALGQYDYAIPTGTCPSVGIAGLTLAGGLGLLTRQFGLTCDAVISLTVVLADGNIVEVNSQTYPDLFWALRGAGANSFGIVLGFTFKMEYVPEVNFIELTWALDKAQTLNIFNAWQQWVKKLPDSITTSIIFFYNKSSTQIIILALNVGPQPIDEWKKYFDQFNPTIETYHGNYTGAAKLFAASYTQPFSKAKSKFIFEPLSSAGINALIQSFEQLQQDKCNYYVFTEFLSVFGGKVSKGDSSYFARNAFAAMLQFIYWSYEKQTVAALNTNNQIYNNIAPFTSQYSYANLIDYDLGPTYLNAYYGTNVGRLIQIKNKYDPQNIFTWRQGIPLKLNPPSQLSYSVSNKYCDC